MGLDCASTLRCNLQKEKHRDVVGLQSVVVILETRLLRYFVVVAEELNFTRAAAQLHVAQQALSAQIRVLESNLGIELLRRTTRKVELTPAGEVFLQDAREALAQIERAAERARRAARGELGNLRIGHTLTAAYEALPKIVDELRARSPDIRVSTRDFYGAEILPAVAEGRVDLGMAREPETPLGLAAREIRREPWMAALSEFHPLADEPTIPLGALEGEIIAVWPRELNPGYYDALVEVFERAGVKPEFDTAPGGASIWSEVASGRRATLAVASLMHQRPRGMALVPLRSPVPTLGLSVVWRPTDSSPILRRFLEAAEAVSDSEGWLA